MPLPGETGEVFVPSTPPPGQSVPTPDAPLVPAMPSGPQGNYPPAPVVSAGANGGNGSIDPAADRVCAWWMSQRQADMWGPSLSAQFSAGGPLYNLNQWSLQNRDRPFFMPSTALSVWQSLGFAWRIIGATLAYQLPPAGRRTGAKVAWGIGGFLFPTLTTGAVAIRQVMK